MPEAKRPDPRRRTSRPGTPGKPGDAGRAKPRSTSVRRERPPAELPAPASEPGQELERQGTSLRESIAASMEASQNAMADQRFGSTARRAAILAAVVCVLTLTIAGPVRTYFGQRTEMKQLQASEAQLRDQIADLEAQKAKLADPVFIAAQARERLGFVMPGEIPYQVQLPPGAAQPGAAPEGQPPAAGSDPWYTALWHTIADAPHGLSPSPAPQAPPPGPPPPPPPPGG